MPQRYGRAGGRKGSTSGPGRKSGQVAGQEGECICPKCGTKISHKRGIPCLKERCPKCGSPMVRA